MKRTYLFLCIFCAFLTSCTGAPAVHKIALVAPFEGQYNAIGYNALYAARLAFTESKITTIELLAVDDGGTTTATLERLVALEQDPTIRYVLAVTPYLSSIPTTTLSIITVGNWHSPQTATSLTDGQWLMLQATGATATAQMILTDASPIDDVFSQTYRNSAPYTPEPNILAPLIYDTTHWLIDAISSPDLISDAYTGRYHQLILRNGHIQSTQQYERPIASD